MITLSRLNSIFHSLFIYPIQFKHFGKKSKLVAPMRIDGKSNMIVGDNVYIGYHVWLGAMALTGENPLLEIQNGCRIGNFNHIFATQQIIIEKDVLTADKVCILDNLHEFEDITTPIWKQPIKQISPIVIGEGSWLGENVCVLGATIGKHCIIGANSVVTHNIPDYSVAVGSPARVVKQYNFETKKWEKL